jgi:NAD(P)-dependent dehydrogenase (short-subunit alcohol dehydrogenase family)
MSNFNLDFKNKVCYVTGAAAGIGRATALAFAKNGAKVACVDINEKGLSDTVAQIRANGSEAISITCNTSDAKQISQSLAKTIETFGSLNIAFNNAGIEGIPGNTANCTEENWDKVLDINLKGVWLCMKYQIPLMQKHGGGSIVNCASIAGLVGFQNSPAYVASKHGMIGLTKTAALEFARENIRINAVCPGVIQTEMIDRFVQGNKNLLDQLSAGEPIGRIGTPDEIASAVLWLSSTGASFVTGHALTVDGGWVAQ